MPKTPSNSYAGMICAGTCGRTIRTRGYEFELTDTEALHYGRGMCAGCDYREKKAAAAVMDDTTRIHKADLEAWIRSYRTNRGIPAGGLVAA